MNKIGPRVVPCNTEMYSTVKLQSLQSVPHLISYPFFLLEWVKQFVANKILKMELFSRICFMFRDKKIVYTFAKLPVKYLGKNHKYNFKKYFINIFVKVVCTSVLSRMKQNKPNILG